MEKSKEEYLAELKARKTRNIMISWAVALSVMGSAGFGAKLTIDNHKEKVRLEKLAREDLAREKANQEAMRQLDEMNRAQQADIDNWLSAWHSKAIGHFGADILENIPLRGKGEILSDLEASQRKIEEAKRKADSYTTRYRDSFGNWAVSSNRLADQEYEAVLASESSKIRIYKAELERWQYVYMHGEGLPSDF